MNLPAHSFNIYDMIKKNASLHANSTAIISDGKTLSFQDYFLEINALAAALSSQGIQQGDRVAVLAMNCPEYLVLYGAAAALGAVLVPLNWRLSEEELSYVLADSGSRLLFFDEAQKDQALNLKNASVKDGTAFKGKLKLVAIYADQAVAPSSFEAAPSLEQGKAASFLKQGKAASSLKQDKETPSFTFDGSEILNYEKLSADGKEIDVCPDSCNDDSIFCLIYTAAMEGKPRGAALSHSNIIAANLQTCLTMHLDRCDTYLNMLPLFHITGMNLSLAIMQLGGRNVIMEKFDADRALDLVEREKVTLMASFPPILSTLMEALDRKVEEPLDRKHFQLKSLKHVVGIDSPDNIQKFTEKTPSRFWVLYGQSETSGFVTLSDSSESPGSAGRACCISQIGILDENDMELSCGESGEIAVRGPIVFQGFWKNKETKKESIAVRGEVVSECSEELGENLKVEKKKYPPKPAKISFDTSTIRNGWHHTGDVGRIDGEGYLWFEGRKPEKDLIKPGGENVYPAEVESVILTHPDIEETCVIGIPDPKFGEGVKAVCVSKKGAELTENDLIQFVGSRIARYKKPGSVEFVDSLPKKGDGVADRTEVKRLYGQSA